MPYLRIDTNVSKDKIPVGFAKDLSSMLANTLGKPESYCSIGINPDSMLIFGGTDAPCAIVYVMSIGQLGPKENIKHSKVIFEKISANLEIPKDRMYITFDNRPSSDVGYNGTTFYEIFGG